MERFRSLPLPVLLPTLFVLVGVVHLALDSLTDAGRQPIGTRLVAAAVYAVILTGVFGVAIAVRRRRMGGAGALADLQRAVRTGSLPADADPATWRPELERLRSGNRRGRWAVPVVAALSIGLSIWLAATEEPFWWLFAAFFAVVWSLVYWQSVRAVRRIEGLLRELDARPSTGTPAPTPGAVWPGSGGRS